MGRETERKKEDLLVLFDMRRTNMAEITEISIFFFSFKIKQPPLAHHHYRQAGTRRTTAPYFQYMCTCIYKCIYIYIHLYI